MKPAGPSAKINFFYVPPPPIMYIIIKLQTDLLKKDDLK